VKYGLLWVVACLASSQLLAATRGETGIGAGSTATGIASSPESQISPRSAHRDEVPSSHGNWPAWRRDGSGIADDKHLPAVWSENENVLWRTALPGEGNSSPIVWGNRLFLTASLDEGTKRLVLCLDADTGKILWRRQFLPDAPSTFYQKTGFAAPTPTTDGQRVYAAFDTPGLIALDMRGELVWKFGWGPIKSPYNMGSSPVLYRDTVIQCCDHNGQAFLVSLDRKDGHQRWRTPRESSKCGHYGTPLVIGVDGRFQIVVNAEPVIAYDPDTGKQLWSCHGMKECVGPSPAFGHGLLYASSGRTGPVMAIDPRGRGNVTESHVLLHLTSGGPYVPTPLVYPHLMVPGDNGRMLFYNAACELVLEDRVHDHFTSSPVGADGKIYWCSERGKTYVIDATRLGGKTPSFKLLSVNELPGVFLATPAIAGGRLFLRTTEALYCVAETGKARLVHSGKTLTGTFAELKRRFEEHKAVWTNEPEAQIRLETLEAIARLDDPEVVPFLLYVVLKEPHWDICEEAVKSLGRKGPPATDSLVGLVKDTRPFIRTVAIIDLGRLKVAKAVPELLVATHDKQPLVRCAALESLAQIAQEDSASTAKIVAVLIAALNDPEEDSVVKQSALDGLAILAAKAGVQREEIVRTLVILQGGGNPRLAKKAQDILSNAYQATPAVLQKPGSRIRDKSKN
jgi:outer membrane protein assembly factor BamB/HEAT repeat protein